MRISDWSSDVCSSDLIPVTIGASVESDQFGNEARIGRLGFRSGGFEMQPLSLPQAMEHSVDASWGLVRMMATGVAPIVRSEERRVGKEGVSPCRLWGAPYH